jgi:hypothetical protein
MVCLLLYRKLYLVCALLYHFNRKFTNFENLLAEMADKYSFEF